MIGTASTRPVNPRLVNLLKKKHKSIEMGKEIYTLIESEYKELKEKLLGKLISSGYSQELLYKVLPLLLFHLIPSSE